jgi:hypothetical protein
MKLNYKVIPSGYFMRFHSINYLVTSNLIMSCHWIYKERDETNFIGMKPIQLIFNVLETV